MLTTTTDSQIAEGGNFTTFVEQHQRNACCEIPAAIIYRAIVLAQQVPFEGGSPYGYGRNSSELHPAMLCLAQWWNQNAPTLAYGCAAHARLWVLLENNDKYHSGHEEIPPRSIKQGYFNPECNARWDNFLLLEFAQGHSQIYDDSILLTCFGVDGEIFEQVGGITLEEYDPAKNGLVALQQFPQRFEVAWRALKQAVLAD